MKKASLICALAAIVVACALVAKSHRRSEDPPPRERTDDLSPVENYKQKVVVEALRGLLYKDGRVVLDLDRARDVESVDADAAADRLARGYDLLERHNQVLLALKEMTDAVIARPNDPDMYVGLGCALDRKGKVAKAEAAYRTALDLDTDHGDALRSLAALVYGEGRRVEAIEIWNSVLAKDPNDATVLLRLSLAQYYAGQIELAVDYLERADRGNADVPPQYRLLLDAAVAGTTVPKLPVTHASYAGGFPVVGPQLRADAVGGTAAANEISVATAAVDPNEVVVAVNDWRDSQFQEILRVGVSVTHDGGESWTELHVRPPEGRRTNVEADPMTAYDHRTGTLWVGGVVFGPEGGLFVARKTPGLARFERSVFLPEASFSDKCWMAAGPAPGNPNATHVYIADREGVRRSTDMGSTWQGRVPLLGAILGPLPRVASDGDLFVTAWDVVDEHWLYRSSDSGASFDPRQLIALRMDIGGSYGSRFPGTFRVLPFGVSAVDPNDGTLYFLFPDTTDLVGGNANVDLYLTKSIDEGSTWSTPAAIGFDGAQIGDQFFPWIEIDDESRLHLVYYDSQNTLQDDDVIDGMLDAYYAYSEDAGATWTAHRLTPAPFNSNDDGLDRKSGQFIGDYNGLAIGGTRVYPSYMSTQNGDADIFVHAIDWGVPPPQFLALEMTTSNSSVPRGERLVFDAILDTHPDMGSTVVEYELTAEKPNGIPYEGNPVLLRTKNTPPGIHKEREIRFRVPSDAAIGPWRMLLSAVSDDGRHAKAEIHFSVTF